MPVSDNYKGEKAFLELGEGFADEVQAANFPQAILRYRNDRAAASVGLFELTDGEWINHFARFKPLPDNLQTPLAQRYHGHQFRNYNPDIGDGRGFLYAQMRDDQGRLMDLGTKGSGTTPYSRSGDGRLTLKGGVREIMASEMLNALGAYTSDTLSIIETGERLVRGDEPSPTRSAVMVRLTHGHIRIGTFQRHAYFSDKDRINTLIDYCLKHYYNEMPFGSPADRALLFLERVMERAAEQAADLMAAGYVHGVLNTDNINITGEIFDFGPWRLLPNMDLSFTAAYFDEQGLYAFGRQADALHWNIYQLGGALADIAEEADLKAVLAKFPSLYFTALRARLLNRMGVKAKDDQSDDAMLKLVNDYMITEKAPYERFFYDWYGGKLAETRYRKSPEEGKYLDGKYDEMRAAILSYSPRNPNFVDHQYFRNGKPCTFLIEEVEAIWNEIAHHDDWQPLYNKLDQIKIMADALSR
ncbi:protein adenylyltransferase SelO family protein [Kordiimonas sp. SCSIO 12610]|uniref:protein adenylyltransferase SelO family protein n=1 Tax=Kordiimonas sp. SCSIO 12610 TaxID=2829597 RepID=UPI00210B6B5A|nr:YdiU family protein [Kordiimonas sp. SCSIO 12610]UTW55966.1 YdiU family protein [Kordiimonas sp. SCSIO 12610]